LSPASLPQAAMVLTGFFWVFNFGNLLLWRKISRLATCQRFIHRLWGGRLALALQWYSLFFISACYVVLLSVIEHFEYHAMEQEAIEQSLLDIYDFNKAKNITIFKGFCKIGECVALSREEFPAALHINEWLRIVSAVGMIAGVAAISINLVHVAMVVRSFKKCGCEDSTWSANPWKLTDRMDWVFLIFCMPVVLCVASMRASCRSWRLLTGNMPCSRPGVVCPAGAAAALWATDNTDNSFPSLEKFEFALYRSDLELAEMFQFYAVFGFVKLMSEYVGNHSVLKSVRYRMPELEDTVVEYQTIIKTACFLGAWAFIIMGLVRTFVLFMTAKLRTLSQTVELAHNLEEQMLLVSSLQAAFIALTVVCIINMFLVCTMNSVQTKMPNANCKFTGARMLLIMAPLQKHGLSAFTFGSPVNMHVEHLLGRKDLAFFTPEVSYLVHFTLLIWECLAIVIMNFIWWRPWDMDVEQAELTPRFEKDNFGFEFIWQLVAPPLNQDRSGEQLLERSPENERLIGTACAQQQENNQQSSHLRPGAHKPRNLSI